MDLDGDKTRITQMFSEFRVIDPTRLDRPVSDNCNVGTECQVRIVRTVYMHVPMRCVFLDSKSRWLQPGSH